MVKWPCLSPSTLHAMSDTTSFIHFPAPCCIFVCVWLCSATKEQNLYLDSLWLLYNLTSNLPLCFFECTLIHMPLNKEQYVHQQSAGKISPEPSFTIRVKQAKAVQGMNLLIHLLILFNITIRTHSYKPYFLWKELAMDGPSGWRSGFVTLTRCLPNVPFRLANVK